MEALPPRHGPVAQLDRALPSEGKGRTFESSRVRQTNQRFKGLADWWRNRPSYHIATTRSADELRRYEHAVAVSVAGSCGAVPADRFSVECADQRLPSVCGSKLEHPMPCARCMARRHPSVTRNLDHFRNPMGRRSAGSGATHRQAPQKKSRFTPARVPFGSPTSGAVVHLLPHFTYPGAALRRDFK
jgi:hypothetical protein